ncbi:hypothetical protein F6V25_15210 [Oryzomonas japonica]|uniref:Uncharacterized protein n=1 Tax=Oryzomonas japonica TaxID=2603858 RepID=A0A7J4ZMB4_9BACT|nr:hypothetical protein [Oryzomonas japonica]KAB0663780.1 hypothetical protein F6V25_15210 [Oryzomonas japonica]
MKKMILVVMAVGLLGAMPVLAADNGDTTMNSEEGLRQCALQAESENRLRMPTSTLTVIYGSYAKYGGYRCRL